MLESVIAVNSIKKTSKTKSFVARLKHSKIANIARSHKRMFELKEALIMTAA